MKKLLLAMLLALGFLVSPISPVSPASAGPYEGYASFTDCVQPSAYQSQYVCFDETTAYGPVIYIRYSNGSYATAGVSYPSWSFGACRSFADPPAHLIPGAGPNAFNLGGTWPSSAPNGSVCPNMSGGLAPYADKWCNGGSGNGLIGLCGNTAMFNSLRTVAGNESFWFYWAD